MYIKNPLIQLLSTSPPSNNELYPGPALLEQKKLTVRGVDLRI